MFKLINWILIKLRLKTDDKLVEACRTYAQAELEYFLNMQVFINTANKKYPNVEMLNLDRISFDRPPRFINGELKVLDYGQ